MHLTKKIIFSFLIAINLLFIANSASAEKFDIQNYDIVIKVSENKTLTVTENIDTYFYKPAHGIFRKIPVKRNENIISLKANDISRSDFKNGKYTIRLGSPDSLIIGEKNYIIKYKHKINDYKNELYYNIIGTEWNTPIHNVSFKIIMPKKINPANVGISIGPFGAIGFKGIARYQVNGNIITGKMLKKLPKKNGITIKINLPKNYFTFPHQTFFEKYQQHIFSGIIIILTLISVVVWLLFGKDKHITPIVTFYPPKGLSSAQVGIIHSEKVKKEHLISLIYSLAADGYIEIITENSSDNEPDFKLVKLKEYDGIDKIQAKLMEILFTANQNLKLDFYNINAFNEALKNNSQDVATTKILGMEVSYYKGTNAMNNYQINPSIVTSCELQYSKTFYKEMIKLEKTLENFTNQIFTKSSLGFFIHAIIALCTAGVLVILSALILNFDFYFDFDTNPDSKKFLFMAIFAFLSFAKTFMAANFFIHDIVKDKLGCIVVFLLPFNLIPIGLVLYGAYTSDLMPLAILGIVCFYINVICYGNLHRWNAEARRLKAEILGFEKFLQVAEKHQLENLIRENPNYCYDIIPFAYSLDITDTWIKKLETLAMTNPNWCKGHFSSGSFSSMSKSLYNSARPNPSNGGASSRGGGGFSGGGSGGGGGGSW